MSSENDPTAPIATGRGHGEQPTAPIRRPVAGRSDDPTQALGTGHPAPRTDEPTDRTKPLTVDSAGTTGSPTVGTVDTAGTTEPPTDDRDTPAPAGERGRRTGPRVGTVVWGLVIAVIGAGVVAAAAGARFDLELAFIVLLALAGIGLVAGSVAVGLRNRH